MNLINAIKTIFNQAINEMSKESMVEFSVSYPTNATLPKSLQYSNSNYRFKPGNPPHSLVNCLLVPLLRLQPQLSHIWTYTYNIIWNATTFLTKWGRNTKNQPLNLFFQWRCHSCYLTGQFFLMFYLFGVRLKSTKNYQNFNPI